VFDHLRGEIVRKTPTEAVIDVQGVGYLVTISLKCFESLPASGPATLWVHVHSSESGTRLYGFVEQEERALFRMLQGVRGVGPGVARTLLSHEAPSQLAARIRAGDVKGLMRMKGIGTKTAERLVVELRDRLGRGIAATGTEPVEQVLGQALMSLGLDESEAARRARAVVETLPGESRVEVLLREALRARSAAR
jgi:Holliday junction DNA helicase RuvA